MYNFYIVDASKMLRFKFKNFHCLCSCVYLGGCHAGMEIRGQLEGMDSVLLPCGSRGLNSVYQA